MVEDNTTVSRTPGQRTKVLAACVVGVFVLAACSSTSTSGGGGSPSTTVPKLSACPQDSAGAPGGGAPPGGAQSIPVAKTVAKTDTSTSVVVDPTGPQIQCGKTSLTSTTTNIVYATPTTNGKQTQLKMDIQVPKTAGKKPLVIYLTGGGFQFAGQSANLGQRTYIAEQGYVVASIQYRTIANGAIYSDAVADVKSAIRYLRAHATTYGIDPSKVAVWGQSAGGYLAAMTGVTNGLEQFEDGSNPGQSSTVQAVVDEFGPSDISKVAADFDPAAKQANYAAGNSLAKFVFGPNTTLSVKDDPAAMARANPLSYARKSSPPFVLLHGSADQLVSPSQTLILQKALRAKGVESTRYVVQGANHGDVTFLGGAATSAEQWSSKQVMDDIVSFLGNNLY